MNVGAFCKQWPLPKLTDWPHTIHTVLLLLPIMFSTVTCGLTLPQIPLYFSSGTLPCCSRLCYVGAERGALCLEFAWYT